MKSNVILFVSLFAFSSTLYACDEGGGYFGKRKASYRMAGNSCCNSCNMQEPTYMVESEVHASNPMTVPFLKSKEENINMVRFTDLENRLDRLTSQVEALTKKMEDREQSNLRSPSTIK